MATLNYIYSKTRTCRHSQNLRPGRLDPTQPSQTLLCLKVIQQTPACSFYLHNNF